jgi:leader peptidase (prepilin peptidase)/N-methyltransferase
MDRDATPIPVKELFRRPRGVILGAVTLALIGGVVVLWGATATALAYSFFVVVGVLLSVIDLYSRLLPNRIVIPSIGVGLVVLSIASAVDSGGASNENAWGHLMRVVLGGFALFSVFLVLALMSPRGMGMGDVKLAGFIGMFLAFEGWRTLVVGAGASFVLAALVGAALLVTGRASRSSAIPFGPLMFLGAALALVYDNVSG